MRTPRQASLRVKIWYIFILYLLVNVLYGGVYYLIYLYDSQAFTFNAELRDKQLEWGYQYWQGVLKTNITPDYRQLQADTIVTKDKIIIRSPKKVYQYLVGRDTINVSDTAAIPMKALEIVNSLENQHLFWNPLDFVYFSVMTLSTVGYSDIYPNSTKIRLVVISEIIAGFVLLYLLLSIVLNDLRKHKMPE